MNPPPLHLLPSGPQVSLRGRGAAPPCPDPGVQAPSALATTLPTPSTPPLPSGERLPLPKRAARPVAPGAHSAWWLPLTPRGPGPSPRLRPGRDSSSPPCPPCPFSAGQRSWHSRSRTGAPGHAGPWRSRGAQGGAGRRETEENGKDGLRGMGGGGPTGVCEPQARGGHQQTPNKS